MRTFLITASVFCAAAFIAGCVDEDEGGDYCKRCRKQRNAEEEE